MVPLTIRFTLISWLLDVATIVRVRNVCSRTQHVFMSQKIVANCFFWNKPTNAGRFRKYVVM